jgi:hypothetical protein
VSSLPTLQKYYLIPFFSLAAHLPVQDVSGDAQTHFGAGHYRLLGLVMHSGSVDGSHEYKQNKANKLPCFIDRLQAQNPHNATQKFIIGSTKMCPNTIYPSFLRKTWIGPRGR